MDTVANLSARVREQSANNQRKFFVRSFASLENVNGRTARKRDSARYNLVQTFEANV